MTKTIEREKTILTKKSRNGDNTVISLLKSINNKLDRPRDKRELSTNHILSILGIILVIVFGLFASIKTDLNRLENRIDQLNDKIDNHYKEIVKLLKK